MKKLLKILIIASLLFCFLVSPLAAEELSVKEVITYDLRTKKVKRGSHYIRVIYKVPVKRTIIIETINDEGEVESTVEIQLSIKDTTEVVVTKEEAKELKGKEEILKKTDVKPKNDEALKKLREKIEKINKAKAEAQAKGKESVKIDIDKDIEEFLESDFGIDESSFGISEEDFEIK